MLIRHLFVAAATAASAMHAGAQAPAPTDATSTRTRDWACIRWFESRNDYRSRSNEPYTGAYQIANFVWHSTLHMPGQRRCVGCESAPERLLVVGVHMGAVFSVDPVREAGELSRGAWAQDRSRRLSAPAHCRPSRRAQLRDVRAFVARLPAGDQPCSARQLRPGR